TIPAAGRASRAVSPEANNSAGGSGTSLNRGGNAGSSGSRTQAPRRFRWSRISWPAWGDSARIAVAAARLNPGSAAIAPCGERSAGSREQVELGQHHDMRLRRQLGRIRRRLPQQQLVGRLRVGTVHRYEHRDEPGALHVLQELEAQPLPEVRAFDDAGNIRG